MSTIKRKWLLGSPSLQCEVLYRRVHVRSTLLTVKATAIALVAMLCSCAGLPPLADRRQSRSLTAAEADETRLGCATGPQAQANRGQSGVLNVQVYIWHADLTVTLLMLAVRAAVDRGVRVRPLRDDNTTRGLDDRLTGLDSYPNIEVRLFNPFLQRDLR